MNNENLNKLISEALAIEARDAKESGALGFMARALVQATMPHSKVEGNEFKRRNGAFRLTILADSETGLPYGSIPRLLIAWITTEAVRANNKQLILGDSLSRFMSQLNLVPTGGRWGSITRLREQMKRLFSAAISCTYDDGENWAIKNVQPVTQANLWWHPKSPNQASLFESTLTLGEEFFNEVTTYPIPIDMDVVKAIKQSPLALDIYCWLTYRMSYLKRNSTIPWEVLKIQFGADYANDSQGTRNFKRAFLRELRKVELFYRVNMEHEEIGLTLKRSNTHIQKQQKIIKAPSPPSSIEKKPVEHKENKKNRLKYEFYKFSSIIKIIEHELSSEERKALLYEFNDYLYRRKLNHLHYVKDNLSDSEKALKEHLCDFISSRRHHLLASIRSFDDYIKDTHTTPQA